MYSIYMVKPGDTLDIISANLRVPKELLIMINGFSNNRVLTPGEQIIVPRGNMQTGTYKVKKGDTIFNIARELAIDPKVLLLINGLEESDYIYPDQDLVLPDKNMTYYVTKKSDTIKEVVDNLNVPVTKLLQENTMLMLEPNQIIVVR